MPITYCDVPLLLEDPGRELSGWIDQAIALEDARLFGRQPVALEEGRWIPRNSARAHVGLTQPNYSAPPRLKINSLWLPTGAARWGVGLFLIDRAGLDKIVAALGSDNSGTLTITEDAISRGTGVANRAISLPMCLLPPRPVTIKNTGSDGKALPRLYLLPLVDRRYLWQYVDAGPLTVTCNTTWQDVIDQLEGQLGIDLSNAPVSSAWLRPDPVELTRQYENAAVLLDAVAWNVGQRVVPELDGSFRMMSWTTSTATYATNGTKAKWLWAGGGRNTQQQLRRPDNVRVVFPVYRNGVIDEGGEVYPLTVGGAAGESFGGYKTFFDTMRANLPPGSSVPTNYGDLVALTYRIAADYWAATAQGSYDFTVAGIIDWAPTSFDDWV